MLAVLSTLDLLNGIEPLIRIMAEYAWRPSTNELVVLPNVAGIRRIERTINVDGSSATLNVSVLNDRTYCIDQEISLPDPSCPGYSITTRFHSIEPDLIIGIALHTTLWVARWTLPLKEPLVFSPLALPLSREPRRIFLDYMSGATLSPYGYGTFSVGFDRRYWQIRQLNGATHPTVESVVGDVANPNEQPWHSYCVSEPRSNGRCTVWSCTMIDHVNQWLYKDDMKLANISTGGEGVTRIIYHRGLLWTLTSMTSNDNWHVHCYDADTGMKLADYPGTWKNTNVPSKRPLLELLSLGRHIVLYNVADETIVQLYS